MSGPDDGKASGGDAGDPATSYVVIDTAELAYVMVQPTPPPDWRLPDWLHWALSGAAIQLQPIVNHARNYPTRAELRAKLDKLREAISTVSSALHDCVGRRIRHLRPVQFATQGR